MIKIPDFSKLSKKMKIGILAGVSSSILILAIGLGVGLGITSDSSPETLGERGNAFITSYNARENQGTINSDELVNKYLVMCVWVSSDPDNLSEEQTKKLIDETRVSTKTKSKVPGTLGKAVFLKAGSSHWLCYDYSTTKTEPTPEPTKPTEPENTVVIAISATVTTKLPSTAPETEAAKTDLLNRGTRWINKIETAREKNGGKPGRTVIYSATQDNRVYCTATPILEQYNTPDKIETYIKAVRDALQVQLSYNRVLHVGTIGKWVSFNLLNKDWICFEYIEPST